VHAHGGEDEATTQRGQACRVAREASEGEQEATREEPDVEEQARHARLGGDGDRRGVRGGGFRLAAFQVRDLRVGVLEVADPYASGRMMHRDLDPVANQLPAAAGRGVEAATVAEELVAHVRHRQRSDGDRRRRHHRDHRPAPTPREDRGDHDPGGERREARLRVREEEPGPDRGNRCGGPDQQPPIAAEQDCDEAREDRDDQEAPVDRRVPEDRVDAVEGRVGVGHKQLRVPEDVARLILVDADRREDERQRRHLD